MEHVNMIVKSTGRDKECMPDKIMILYTMVLKVHMYLFWIKLIKVLMWGGMFRGTCDWNEV